MAASKKEYQVSVSKSDIVSRVAEETGHTKTLVSAVVDATITQIGQALVEGEDVRLHAFGTFAVKETKARQARNPMTGDIVDVPAGRKVSFKPSSELKKVI
jgi:DNA-binding protein HU-beta